MKIAIESLCKSYGKVIAVESLNLQLVPGRIHALLGTNGAGKTTTLDCLVGVLQPSSGRILLDGEPVGNLSRSIRGALGFLPEGFEAFTNLTVGQNVEYFQRLAGVRGSTSALLERLGLTEIAGRGYQQCSRGERLKTNLALTLVSDPQVLVLDEPTVGLDPVSRRAVWGIIRDCRQAGKTILFSTHYMEEAELLSDHLTIMNRGRIVAEGPVADIVGKHSEGARVLIHGLDRAGEDAIAERFPQYAVSRRGDVTVVEVPDDARMAEIVDALQDLPCENITCQRRSLETAFLRLTEGRHVA